MNEYQRYLTPGFEPFDPLELARETEKIVTRKGKEGLERKYADIYSAPVYGVIATGYAVGCCLRCIYCWTNWSRDFPEGFGNFYSPKEVAQRLFKAATPEGFTQRTGAVGRYYELPFKALQYLLDEGIYARAAAMTDSKVMPKEERRILIAKLSEIDRAANYSTTLEEEQIDAYDTTIKRLNAFTDAEFAKKLEKEIKATG